MAVSDAEELNDLTARLRASLGDAHGKLRVEDALRLAGFAHASYYRSRLLTRALRDLGWIRVRVRFGGQPIYAYARGSLLEREVILDVVPGDDDRLVVKSREP